MQKMTTTRLAVSAAAAALALALGATGASAECKMVQTASATGILKGTTGLQARASWRLAVIARDGIAFSLWSKAKRSSTVCRKKDKWHCVASARPCN